jgi:hypothetical protein
MLMIVPRHRAGECETPSRQFADVSGCRVIFDRRLVERRRDLRPWQASSAAVASGVPARSTVHAAPSSSRARAPAFSRRQDPRRWACTNIRLVARRDKGCG